MRVRHKQYLNRNPYCAGRTFRTKLASVPDAADLTSAFAHAVAELETRGFERKQIAAHIGVEPPTLSRYVNGKAGVQVEHLPLIDSLLGERLGYVLRLAGFVDPETDTRTALRTDRGLGPGQRVALVQIYDGLIDLQTLRTPGAESGLADGTSGAG